MIDSRSTWRRRSTHLLVVVLVLSGGGLAGTAKSPLLVDPSHYDFAENPKLLQRILSSPHGYYRFINVAFGRYVCTRYQSLMAGTPLMNLHGDAHVEQYAVTDLGRGLTDFDDSSVGPGLLDVLRFGVSLGLTCEANGWDDCRAKAFDRFLQGYSEALQDPTLKVGEPVVSRRVRSGFVSDRRSYLHKVDGMMLPVPQDVAGRLIEEFQTYADSVRLERAELSTEFFKVVKLGYLKLGIGSALDTKFLVRLRGLTDDPDDDVVVEVKQVRDLQGIGCVQASKNDPFRILLSQARIAYQPFDLLGYVRFDNLVFWVHSWVDNYREVSHKDSFRTPEELAELSYDVGVQLGLGHPKLIAAPFDAQVRRAQLKLLQRRRSQIEEACRELIEEVKRAWSEFAEAVR